MRDNFADLALAGFFEFFERGTETSDARTRKSGARRADMRIAATDA
jgi:hypothetical protein